MGSISSSSETAFTQSPEELYDFVTDPRNWPMVFPGSTGIEGVDDLPLRVGHEWNEWGVLGDYHPHFTWRLFTAIRPVKWAFQNIGRLARNADGTGGFEGLMTVTYTFSSPGAGVTLFHRSMVTEVAKFEPMPQPIVLLHDPSSIDAYHEAVAKALG
jgi:hypothetical protein